MPTIPGWLAIAAGALLAAAQWLAGQSLPPWLSPIVAAAVPVLVWVAHLQVSAKTAKQLGGGK